MPFSPQPVSKSGDARPKSRAVRIKVLFWIMNQTLFIEKAEALLRKVEDSDALSMADADRSGNVLTIEFDSGEQIVINIQTPTEQVWLASRVTGGFHFSWDGEAWKDSDGEDFWSVLGRAASQLSGETVTFE